MKLVYGVGINDCPRGTTKKDKIYKVWSGMLKRCYSEDYHKQRPTYIDCKVCDEWLTFSKFSEWVKTQDWEGKQLDKDIITPGNKVYSPDNCMFVTQAINSLLTVSKSNKGDLPVGVFFLNHKILPKPYQATIRHNNFIERLGYYATPEEAHRAWIKRKREIIAEVISRQDDQRLITGLLLRLDMLDTAYENNLEITRL